MREVIKMYKIKWANTDNQGFYKDEAVHYNTFETVEEAGEFITDCMKNEKNFFLLDFKYIEG